MASVSRRRFLQVGAAVLSGALGRNIGWTFQPPGERPPRTPDVIVLNPRCRVPVSLIIDDSTCLVNLAHFAMPQFAEVWPNRAEYQKSWRQFPREIPDAFVQKFMAWCGENGVKGKYSVVPYPACVGWLDRDLPGWSHQELERSLRIVREEIMPHWDIHPEMVTHTWVINTKTGRPYEERSQRFMENWGWSEGRSAEELTDYIAYALQILKNAGLRCEGITTPGGFGSRARPQLSIATLEACRDVFQVEIPHYFRDVFTGAESVAPRVENATGLDGPEPRCVVSIIGCTGDWFGGWDGDTPGSPDKFITPDLASGRLVEVITRDEPAVMVCHWPGMFFNGKELGFRILQEVVKRLHARFDNLIWMNLSEIARYWAARELTRITIARQQIAFTAPFACPGFTIELSRNPQKAPQLHHESQRVVFQEVSSWRDLRPGTFCKKNQGHGDRYVFCFDLPKGKSFIALQ